ncbi:hypothetical protein RSOLAG1IB_10933 [Rhizoctonia solani AG-1 IB]|uniref:DDE Tnp4 domain-containing protein n=1 Tax=Thanatephorus cucumeris (strain AG1-IB / isolate 7/3/14) TaxID=1108050 RepID=A0A0B7G1V2_THACB|nr:hypothetical protein RSOLAG1IB_10933 [Rhizoctonia solani AG-1 IB]
MITPFQEHEIREAADTRTARLMKKWNKSMSSQRIIVEHTFARLKNWFRYLQGVRGSDLQSAYRAIESMLVLHNILIELGDYTEDLGPSEAAQIMHANAESRTRVEEAEFERANYTENTNSGRRALLVGQAQRLSLMTYWANQRGL